MAKPVAKKPTGRPSLCTPPIVEEICSRIASGETLISVCRDPRMPAEQTVRGWDLFNTNGFSAHYARARLMQIEHEVEEMKEIADNPLYGQETLERSDGTSETRRGDMFQHRRMQIDTRKWRASKLNAQRYGDRLAALEETGETKVEVKGGLPDG